MSLAVPHHRPVLADLIARPTDRARAFALDAALVVAGAAVVAVLAQLTIPMWPVPMTAQTLGVLLVGASLGTVRGASAMVVYALAGLAGLPVVAPSADGTHLTGAALLGGTTFGYIIGFVFAAAVVGLLARRAWDRRVLQAIVAFAAGSIVIYAFGLPWLALALSHLGIPQDQLLAKTFAFGFAPFWLGDIVKAVFAGLLLPVAWRGVRSLEAGTGR